MPLGWCSIVAFGPCEVRSALSPATFGRIRCIHPRAFQLSLSCRHTRGIASSCDVRAHQWADGSPSLRSPPLRLQLRQSSLAPMWFWSYSSLTSSVTEAAAWPWCVGRTIWSVSFGYHSILTAVSLDSALGHAMAPCSLRASPAVEFGTLTSIRLLATATPQHGAPHRRPGYCRVLGGMPHTGWLPGVYYGGLFLNFYTAVPPQA